VFFARGEIPAAEMTAIRERAHHQSAARVSEIERETNHDVVAFVRAVGESVGEPASRHLHRGLTSSDILDTALAMAMRDSLSVLSQATESLRARVAALAVTHRATPCAGRTHGIHAEPTSFGLRLAGWHSELCRNLERLRRCRSEISFGKLSGAVGTYSQTDPEFEADVLKALELEPEPLATQVVPRDRHAAMVGDLALLGGALERFALEIRSLQRTDIREAEEGFRPGQTGSSAMPHKRNPISCERVCGMSRLLRGYSTAALENIALWHDRDISHSSVERVILPDAFHAAHNMVRTLDRVLGNLRVYPENMVANMDRTGGLLFSQSALSALLGVGMDRHAAYKVVQGAAMRVWEGEASTLREALGQTEEVAARLSAAALDEIFEVDRYFEHVDALFSRAGISKVQEGGN